MKAQILKISGHKNEADFYKEFPTMESFMAKHGAAFKKAQSGSTVDRNNDGVPDYLQDYNMQTINPANPYGQYFGGAQVPQKNYAQAATQAASNTFANFNKGFETQGFGQTLKGMFSGGDAGNGGLGKAFGDIGKSFGIGGGSGATPGINGGAGDAGKAGGMGNAGGYIEAAMSIGEGLASIKGEKKQKKKAYSDRDVVNIVRRAYDTNDVNRRQDYMDNFARTRKALMPTVNVDEFFPSYGVGTNPLGQAEHGGGLSRAKDYGSKSKPYPSVSSGDFAGGGRSYPIPTKADAVDALRLAGLHGRGDVKAKVYSKYPELRKGNHGEIMNTYAPGTLYDDLGYEPLEESVYQPINNPNAIKTYEDGGKMYVAQNGFQNFMGSEGFNQVATQLGQYNQMSNLGNQFSTTGNIGKFDNAGSKVGSGVLQAVGTYFGGPLGGMIGKYAGKYIGGALDPNYRKIAGANYQKDTDLNYMKNSTGFQNIRTSGFGAYTRDGGTINPQVIKYFGEHDVKDLFKKDPTMNTLRTGGNLRQNSVGDINVLEGGHLEPTGYNPYSDGTGVTSMIKGRSHEDGGVFMNYDKAQGGSSMEADVEAEGGEPVTEIGDNAVIFGDIVINDKTVGNDPMFKNLHGKTFKKAMAGIAEQNQKLNKQQTKNTQALNELDVKTPIDKLKFNSLTLNSKAIDTKYAVNDAIMKKAAAHQEVVNNEAQRLGINSGDYSRGKLTTNELSSAKNGKTLKAQYGNEVPFKKKPLSKAALPSGEIGDYTTIPEWESNASYESKWMPAVQEAYNNPDRFKKILNFMNDYKGEGADRLKAFLGQLPTEEAKKNFLLKESTNKQIGPIHNIVRAALANTATTPATPATTTAATTVSATVKDKNFDVTPYQKYGWEDLAGQILPWIRRQPGEPLQLDQLAGEMYALSTNQEEPVQARFYHPNLRTPYDISYQDQLNANQADFNQLARATADNPEALAALAAQKYGANSKVLGEQFRQNQAMKEGVYNQNINTLNDALLKNLAIADQQYVRQATAKSATKAVKQEALNSIASKISQNRLENRTLATYANMFPDYSFDRNFRIRKTGAPTKFNMPVIYNANGEITHIAVKDADGNTVDYRELTPEEKVAATKPSTATPGIVEDSKAKKERSGGIMKAFKNL